MKLRTRAYESDTLSNLADVVKEEIEKRLALEEALRQYLKETPLNPFKAAADLLEFLENDEREEGFIE